MDLIQVFLKLTTHTYPNPHEDKVIPLLYDILPNIDFQKDNFGNIFYQQGDSPTVMFTSHLDTKGDTYKPIVHVITEEYVKTDLTTILGADNKAGVTIMLWMIYNKIPGLYYFFLAEEIGCKGSTYLMEKEPEKLNGIKKAIAFDRRNHGSIITFQKGKRCASEEFATALSEEFKKYGMEYKADTGGFVTDTNSFVKVIPECTNLSAGVFDEHNLTERLDIKYFLKTCEAVIKIDWNGLPSTRDVNKVEHKEYEYVANRKTKYPRTHHDYNNNHNFVDDTFDNQSYKRHSALSGTYLNHNNPISTNISDLDEYPSDEQLLSGFKIIFNKKNIIYLNNIEKSEMLDIYDECYSRYKQIEHIMNEHKFYYDGDFKPNKTLKYKWKEVGKEYINIAVSINWTLEIVFDSIVIENVREMTNYITNIKNKFVKKDITNNIPIVDRDDIQLKRINLLYNIDIDKPISKISLTLSDKSTILVSDFLKENGGNYDILMDFLKLDGITPSNSQSWGKYYKLFLVRYPFITEYKTLLLKIGGNIIKVEQFFRILNIYLFSHQGWEKQYRRFLSNEDFNIPD